MSFLQKEIKEAELKNQNIVVAVRCRPRNDMEKSMNSPVCIECFPERKEIVYRSDKASTYEHEKRFSFDRVFGPNTRQIEVYKGVVAPLISEVLMGYSCTVFAYGQTGTGKTFTMEGERSSDEYSWEKDPLTGIIPRCVHQLFEELHKSRDIIDFSVRVSFLEIYNEELYDLLGGTAEHSIRPRMYEDSSRKGSVIISGMEEVLVKDKEKVYNILQKGAERRQFASTLLNAHSSRSHTVFSVVITMKENSLDGEDLLKTGKLYLVDLAGSENIGRSGAIDRRAREAGTINQSLLTLGRVINALLERKPHIPYRESKLTRLLQDSLGGKTKTCIIATISPAAYNIEETLSTLEYAHRAKKIKNRPEINQKLTQRGLIREYTENIAKLKADLAAARDKNGVYLTEERYNQIKGSIQVHKEMIAELEANLKVANDEFEQLNHMFSETQEQLHKKNTDVENSRKWLHHLKNELVSSIEKINDKSVKLAEYNFTIQNFEEILSSLYKDASLLKSNLEDTTSNAEKLEVKLKQQRNKAIYAHSASVKFESLLSSKIESIIADQNKIITIVDGYKNSYQAKIAFTKSSAKIQSVVDTCNSDTTPIIDEFKDCINNVSSKWHEITIKINELLKYYTEELTTNTIQKFVDELIGDKIKDLTISLDSFNAAANKQLNVSIPSALACISNFLNETNTKIRSFYNNFYELLDQIKNENTKKISEQNDNLLVLQNTFRENVIETEKKSLLDSISQMIDSKFESIQTCVFSDFSNLIDDKRSVLKSSNRQLEQFSTTIKNMDKLSKEVYDSCCNFNTKLETDLNSHVDNVDALYSSQKASLKDIDSQFIKLKEDFNDNLQKMCHSTHQCLNDYSPFYTNYISTTNTLLNRYNEITNECLNSMISMVSDDNANYKELIEKLKRRSETLHNLVSDQVSKLNQKLSQLPDNYRNELLPHVPDVQSAGDTPMVSKSRSIPNIIPKPPSRNSIANVFQESHAQNLHLSPTSKLTTKAFTKLENIADTSSIPDYNVDDTLIEHHHADENQNEDSQLPFLENSKKKKRIKSTFDMINPSDNSNERKLYKRLTE